MMQGRYVPGDYSAATFNFIYHGEGDIDHVYADKYGIPTIGIGYALLIKDSSGTFEVRNNLQSAFKGIHTFSSDEINLLQEITDDLNAKKVALAKAVLEKKPSDLLSFTLTLGKDDVTLFNEAVAENVRSAHLTTIANDPAMAGTYEFLALSDIAYNSPSLVTSTLRSDVVSGDRLDAWYEILTGLNGKHDSGLEVRRISEANEFGLYSTGQGSSTTPTTNDGGAEAIKAVRFLDAHKDALVNALVADHFTASVANADLKGWYAPGYATLENQFASGRTDFKTIILAKSDNGVSLNLSGGQTGNTLIISGLGHDIIQDQSTGVHNNLIVVRATANVAGGTAADLNDGLVFDGHTIDGHPTLDKNGHATDAYGRSYAYSASLHNLKITGPTGDVLTIPNFAPGDFGLTFAHAQAHTITFSEYAVGTHISKQYQPQGIDFGGSGAFISPDGSNPTSPVLSGTPLFNGWIQGTFVDPATGAKATVGEFQLDAGYFDNIGSTQLSWYDASGRLIGSIANNALGIEHFDIVSPTPIASFRISEIGVEAAGFAIDNVAFDTPQKVAGGGTPMVIDQWDQHQHLTQHIGSGQASTSDFIL